MVAAPGLRFCKMHGAGNDFVVLDLRDGQQAPSPGLCRALADRHRGVGCDQILAVEQPRQAGSVAAYRIFNADGSPAQQCGNGARCVAAWLVRDGVARGRREFALDSPAGTHAVVAEEDGSFTIAMGRPVFDASALPMAAAAEAARDPGDGRFRTDLAGHAIAFDAVSMGNPHVLIEVEDIEAAPVAVIGPALQRHVWFPESVNVGFAQVLGRDAIRLRVHERGAGETLACGSGACAAVAALDRRGRVDAARGVDVHLPGGTLRIAYDRDTGSLLMGGPAEFVFEGEWAG